MVLNKSRKIFKIFTLLLMVILSVTVVACSTSATDTDNQTGNETTTSNEVTTDGLTTDGLTTDEVTTVEVTTATPIEMSASLTDLTVNGTTIMGFTPTTLQYVMVLSSSMSASPLVEVVKYDPDSTVVIDEASDVNSEIESDRTTTITVTTEDGLTSVVYTVLFETTIAPINLGTAENYVLLAETGISSETSSIVTGDIGVSPAAATYITGFSLMLDSSGTFATSSQIVGQVFASDYTTPTPSVLTTAISDMRTAYTEAAGRTANYTELYSGDLSGKTLTTGVYKFGSGVLINSDLTLNGSATDVWIFQIDGALTQAANISIILTGGALAENIFWQVADTVSIGTGAHFEGIILAKTNISFGTNTTMNGRLYAQTAITLDASTITSP